MCGLVGIAGDLNHADEDRIKRLLVLDWFRGKDSVGLAGIRNSGEVKIAKTIDSPTQLFDMGKFRDACNANQSCAFIGHNRAATRGAVSHSNAHPFQFDHIVGAHNGTLWPSSHSALEKAMGETYPVDSQAVIAAIAALGIDETIKLMEGAWAVSYFNLDDGTMNFIRNKERNLWYATTRSKNHLVWASEWGMIKGAMYESEGLIARDGEGHGFFEFVEDVHYSFDVRALKDGKEVPKPRVKKMEGKKVGPFRPISRIGGRSGASQGNMRESDPFHREVGNDGATRNQFRPENSTTPQSGSEVAVPFLTITASAADPWGGELTKERFEEISKHGCDLCQQTIDWGEDGVVIWDRDDVIICGNCSGIDKGKNRLFTTKPLTVAA